MMGQAKRKKQAELARTTALERGAKKWDKSVLREVLRGIVPPGIEAIATRYNTLSTELLISCDDGEVRRVPWQTMIDAEREQAPQLIIPKTTMDQAQRFMERTQQEQAAKLQALQQQLEKQQQDREQRQQQDEQRQQRDAERGPDWELAAARCAELEISLRPKELLCCCARGRNGNHITHSTGDPCPEKGVYAVKTLKSNRRNFRNPVLCEVCALEQIPRMSTCYVLDCEP